MREVRAAREAFPHGYVKVVCYDRSLGRQTTALSFIVGRPEDEPGFRLERQEKADRAGPLHGPLLRRRRPCGPALSVMSVALVEPVGSAADVVRAVLDDIDRELVALAPVKTRIREIAALLVIDRLREDAGLRSVRPSLHMSFTGNPGTGKTTVALRMAEILHRLGYIETPRVVAVTRDDLVGQYVGHTAPKTKEVLKRAYGGVLFIDEAYYLHRPENERDYGQEAIEILLQVMEAERERLVVVLAGYRDRMETFFRSNPGMGSRIAHHVDFPDYDVSELMDIARADARAAGLRARRGRGGRAEALHRAPRRAAAVRQRAQHPQRDRPRAAAPGGQAVRAFRRALTHPARDHRGRRHPRQLGVRRKAV